MNELYLWMIVFVIFLSSETLLGNLIGIAIAIAAAFSLLLAYLGVDFNFQIISFVFIHFRIYTVV